LNLGQHQAEIRQMNAEPAQMVPVSGWIGGRTLGLDGF
jgi:hypothetical protein